MKKEQKQQVSTEQSNVLYTLLPTVTCRLCSEKGRVRQLKNGYRHCTNCGNYW